MAIRHVPKTSPHVLVPLYAISCARRPPQQSSPHQSETRLHAVNVHPVTIGASHDTATTEPTKVSASAREGGSHVYENSATAPARAAARRTASARRSGPEAGRGVLCRANGGVGAAPVAGREGRGRRQFFRPWIRSAEQRRRPPSALVTATLPPRLTAADGISVSIVFAGARCPHTATFYVRCRGREAFTAGRRLRPGARLEACCLEKRVPDE